MKLNPAAPVYSTFNYQYFTGIANFESVASYVENLRISPTDLLNDSPAYRCTVDLFASHIFEPDFAASYIETFDQI